MSLNSFTIKKSEGLKFAKYTGDHNLVHIDEIAGHNSIYGKNIIHGVFVILKFLQKIKFKSKYSYIKIIFIDGLQYNDKIKIHKLSTSQNNESYQLVQESNIKAKIEIGYFPTRYKIENLNKISLKRKYKKSKKSKSKIIPKGVPEDLVESLSQLTKYVGTVYPGKNSLISEVNISMNESNNNNILINSDSSLISKGFPVIENRLVYKKYKIQFKTLIRPTLDVSFKRPSKKVLKEIKLVRDNIFIIGASSGIGNDLLKLFLNNNKIKVIASYYKNKLFISKKNLIIKKINIEKDLSLIFKIISKYSPLIIYYFPTPKILFKGIKNKKIIKQYKKHFIELPLKIIKYSNNYSCKFFYPSTTYSNISSPYFLIKLKAENSIKKLKNIKTKINILKIPGINTKQNLSLISKKLPNFRDLIENNNNFFNKIFFKK